MSENKTCSGTIISEDIVLTTADCVYGSDFKKVSIIAGHSNIELIEDKYQVTEIIIHGLYEHDQKFNTDIYNIAILKLSNSFQLSASIYPICLPSNVCN